MEIFRLRFSSHVDPLQPVKLDQYEDDHADNAEYSGDCVPRQLEIP